VLDIASLPPQMAESENQSSECWVIYSLLYNLLCQGTIRSYYLK
jgi:hypothetical protein